VTLKIVALKGERAITEQLKTRGMPSDVLRQRPFDPRFHTLSIKSDNEGYKARRLAKNTQLESLEAILSNPLRTNYTYLIASNPTDLKATYVAAVILERAVIALSKTRMPMGKDSPKWHRVYGGFNDVIRADIQKEADGKANPCLMILSNITTESTPAKLETVRDLLVHYDSVPRIVVVSGSDPITFARRHLRFHFTHYLNLSTSHKTEL
jgi:hypothetical protein